MATKTTDPKQRIQELANQFLQDLAPHLDALSLAEGQAVLEQIREQWKAESDYLADRAEQIQREQRG